MILSALLRISLPIILGYLLKKASYFPEENSDSIRLFCVRVPIPALIFINLYQADMSTVQQFVPASLSTFIFTGIAWLIALGGTALFRIKKHRTEIILVTIFGNIGYIGWAVLDAILGDAGLKRGIFIGSFWWPNLYLYSILTLLVCGGHGSFKGQGKNIAMNLIPSLGAVFLGLLLNMTGILIPSELDIFISSFGTMTVPLILFTVGMSISLRDSVADLKRLLPLTFIRTAISFAAIALTVLMMPMLDDMSRKSLFIEAVMPVAAGTLVMGQVFRLDTRFISAAIALSTLISFITIPVMVGIFA
jgi:malate permease and related proteins